MGDDTKKAQAKLLSMAKIISEILDKHHIPHSMVYGTFLGAIRHHGFVPWDDDFDFCIFDDVYDEAIHWLREELPDDLFVEDAYTEPLYFHSWAHVKDLKSEAISKAFPQDNAYQHKGLSIDLYRMRKLRMADVPSEFEKQILKYINRRRELNLIDDEEYDRRIQYSRRVHEYFKIKFPNETEESLQREVYANIYTSQYCIDEEDFFPLKKYPFEDTEFWGINNADKVLKHWYGDYMELPPEEKRRSHFDEVKFF